LWLGQLLIVHGNSAYFFGEKSIPPSAAGFPSTPIHDCRTYYLNSGAIYTKATAAFFIYRWRDLAWFVFAIDPAV
jgi:hypothetical protein